MSFAWFLCRVRWAWAFFRYSHGAVEFRVSGNEWKGYDFQILKEYDSDEQQAIRP